MNKINLIGLALFTILLSACDQGVDSPRGFSLPEGNAELGQQVFIKHNCLACHSVEGLDNTGIESELEKRVVLGGTSARITTYAELVTSIINPSHRISKGPSDLTTNENGESLMRNYNDVMTVTELVDMVAYLQTKYLIKPIEHTSYSHYYVR